MTEFIKDFDGFLNEAKTEDGKGLAWEFWNQSQSRFEKGVLMPEKKPDMEQEFKNHIVSFKNDIQKIAIALKVREDKIKDFLKKAWDEVNKKKYVDMHDNKKRFDDFVSKNKIK